MSVVCFISSVNSHPSSRDRNAAQWRAAAHGRSLGGHGQDSGRGAWMAKASVPVLDRADVQVWDAPHQRHAGELGAGSGHEGPSCDNFP